MAGPSRAAAQVPRSTARPVAADRQHPLRDCGEGENHPSGTARGNHAEHREPNRRSSDESKSGYADPEQRRRDGSGCARQPVPPGSGMTTSHQGSSTNRAMPSEATDPPNGRPAAQRRRVGPRLPLYRAVLALGLLSAGPPLVIHDGWAGVPPAVAAAGYAVFLLAGKRWPRLYRRRKVAAERGGISRD
jgi:hypothetical protein